jgi:hypothetical protein
MINTDVTRCSPKLWHYLLLYAAVAIWVDFGHIHQRHHSDTLVFTLASQYALTPYFWEQDRVGLLIPALTSWCPNLLSALLLQTGLTVFLGLAAPLLLAEVVCSRPASRVAATFANAVMLAVAPDRIRDILLFECCYPIAISLGCAGVLVLTTGGERPRWWRYPIAAGLFVLAHWVYAGVAVWLLPLVVGLAVFRPGIPVAGIRDAIVRVFRFFPGWASLLLIFGSFGLGIWFMHLARQANPELTQNTPQDSLSRAEWPASWLGFFDSLNQLPKIVLWPEVAGGLAVAGLLAGIVVAGFRRCWPPYPLAAAIVVIGVAGATEFLFIGTQKWPAENLRQPRYIIGFLESTQVILGLAAVFPFAGWIAGRGRWIAFGISALVLFTSATIPYGFPSLDNPRADLDAEIGRLTPDILAADVDAIGGDYWTVWPAVLHANMNSPSRAHPFIGVTMRCSVFRPYWEKNYRDNMRVGVKDTEKDRDEFLRATMIYGLSKPVRVGSHGSVAIYTTHSIYYSE